MPCSGFPLLDVNFLEIREISLKLSVVPRAVLYSRLEDLNFLLVRMLFSVKKITWQVKKNMYRQILKNLREEAELHSF